jgi:hypothetical protein
MSDNRFNTEYMIQKVKKLVPYIGVGVVIGLLLIVLPLIIRGLFHILLILMKYPLESTIILGVSLLWYSIGLYIGEKSK